MVAADLVSADTGGWTRLLALKHSVPANAEPKAPCYRILHVPARLIYGARNRQLQVPKTWPGVDGIVAAFARIAAIPTPD